MSLVTPLFCWGFVSLAIWPWETATHDSCTLALSAIFEQNLSCPSHILELGVVNFCLSLSQGVVSRRQSSTAWAVTTSRATEGSVKSPWGEGWVFWTRGWTLRRGSESSLKKIKAASQTKQKAPYSVHTIWLMRSFHGRIGRKRWLLKPKFHAPCRPCLIFCHVGTTGRNMKLIPCTGLEHTEAWDEQLHRIKTWSFLDLFVCNILT